MNISKATKVVRVMNAVVAGTTDTQTGTLVDTSGYEGVRFLALIGTVTGGGVCKMHAEQGALVGAGDMADLAGSETGAAASNSMLGLDIYRPTDRYVRPLLVRTTANVVIDGIVAELYGAHSKPVTADATVVSSKLLVSPAEGTI